MKNQLDSHQITEEQTHEQGDQSVKVPQIFYARKMATQAMLFSVLGLAILGWKMLTDQTLSSASILGVVLFSAVFVVNAVFYRRPYVTVGSDFIQVFSRRVPLNLVTKHIQNEKAFVVQYEIASEAGKPVAESALTITMNMIREEDKNGLIFALREAMLKTQMK